jgi:hypothetical protein
MRSFKAPFAKAKSGTSSSSAGFLTLRFPRVEEQAVDRDVFLALFAVVIVTSAVMLLIPT